MMLLSMLAIPVCPYSMWASTKLLPISILPIWFCNLCYLPFENICMLGSVFINKTN